MNWLIISSGVLASITAFFHIFSGGREVAGPLLASTTKEEVKLTMYACWHLVSISLGVSSLALLANGIGFYDSPALIVFISLLWLLYGIVFLAVTLHIAKPKGLFRFPQWTILIPVGLLGLLGVILR